jgi:hypothetical protein
MDGLFIALKDTKWRISEDGETKSKRMLFHICDAPPHGKEYSATSSIVAWKEKGCPCGITKDSIFDLISTH